MIVMLCHASILFLSSVSAENKGKTKIFICLYKELITVIKTQWLSERSTVVTVRSHHLMSALSETFRRQEFIGLQDFLNFTAQRIPVVPAVLSANYK